MLGFITSLLLVGLPAASHVSHVSHPIHAETYIAAPSTDNTPQTLPENLNLPPNPPVPGKAQAMVLGLHYVLAQRTTNYNHASPSQAKNIELVARRLHGVIVQPGETFSYFKTVGPYTEENGYGWGRAFSGDRIVPSMGGGVCQGASTLYSTLLRTGLPVVERHQHSLTVPYLPAGEDATVAAAANKDFRFKNNLKAPILITAQANPDKRLLTVAIWGTCPAPKIDVRHRILAVYPFKTIEHGAKTDDDKKVLSPGQKGGTVETWLEIKSKQGVIRKPLGTDKYLPSPRVIGSLDS